LSDLGRKLRRDQTDAEELLWQRIRNRQLAGCKFRRQHRFAPYIVDFVCIERKLIIEIDCGQHIANREADAKRTAHLEGRGYNVLRFWNREVIEDTNTVIECILQNLNSMRQCKNCVVPNSLSAS